MSITSLPRSLVLACAATATLAIPGAAWAGPGSAGPLQQVAVPGTSVCVGGTHLRATDPWVTFSPDGTAYYFTLATSAGNDSAVIVNRSTDGGLHWGPAVTLLDENSVFNFNDKNSITADPF